MTALPRIPRALLLAVALTAFTLPVHAAGDEAYWRSRALATHRDAADARARYDAASAEYSRARASHRARGDRRAELVEKKRAAEDALEDAERRLTELPDEARRAGVPPGWVRVLPEDL